VRLILVTGALAIAWVALVGVGEVEGWWSTPIAPRGDFPAFSRAVGERLEAGCPGNAVVVLLQGGEARAELACSLGEPVGRDSLFQVASLSKWITAWGVMALVDSGRIGLDDPVSRHVTRWTLPTGAFEADAVTVRRLLSHTAGLTDGLGYDGFGPDERLQTLEESLTRAADAMPDASGVVAVGYAPGSRWQYSGGGYTLLQLLIEEVTGHSFEDAMQAIVLEPLGMGRSTFDPARAEEAGRVTSWAADGQPADYRRFTALAAASLHTSAADLVRFLRAQRPGPAGEPAGRGVLRPETVAEMRAPQAWRFGRAIWGLGTMLYARNGAGGFVVGHDGLNPPAINTAVRLDPASGDGIVVLATGTHSLASTLASEWVLWRTGQVGVLMLVSGLGRTVAVAAAGAAAIVLGAIALYVVRRRPAG
jgi:CubicO group peptidase (beta-lactamase class C family)